MDLFSFSQIDKAQDTNSLPGEANHPLAELIRPKDLREFIGQNKALSEKSGLSKMILAGRVPSLIIWGPPGCGKTTFARLLSKHINAEFISRNAIDTGAKILKEEGELARQRKLHANRRSILFIDEIHRLNKAQQDALLPYVERGDFTLIGATTENPSYALNSALLSRTRLLVFEPLAQPSLLEIAQRACAYQNVALSDVLNSEASKALLLAVGGDARQLINQLEYILWILASQGKSTQDNTEASIYHFPLNPSDLNDILSQSAQVYDRLGDAHYDCISAFIKSIRGSDADAGLYYLARMLDGGEDPVFIARRLIILSSEDIGNADPRALNVAVNGLQAVEVVGLPEAGIVLAQVVTYLATAPKSNASYLGLKAAQEEVKATKHCQVPLDLRSAGTASMKGLGYGLHYQYPHDAPKAWVAQNYFPAGVQNKKFYKPTDRGFEQHIQKYMEWLKSKTSQ